MQITCHKIGIFIFLMSFWVSGFASGTRTTFLTHGPSAAAYGRGETATASVDDATDVFYNPASLAYLPSAGVSVSHFPLMDGTRYNYLGVAIPLKRWAFGFSGVNLCSGDIEVRRTLTDIPSVIQVNEWAYAGTVAYRFKKPFDCAIGVSAKCVSLDLYGYRGSGWGLDTGVSRQWQGPRLWGNKTVIRSGFSVINIVPPSITLISDKETYPVSYHAGVAFDMPVVYRLVSSDIVSLYLDSRAEEQQALYAVGVEYAFMNKYILRAGSFDDHVTAGFGYKHPLFRIDYAIDYSRFAMVSKVGMSFYFSRSKGKVKKNAVLMAEAKVALSEDKQFRKQRDSKAKDLFNEARNSYHQKRYLTAIEQFRRLKLEYPEFEMADQYYDDILVMMDEKSRGVNEDNLEWVSYAIAFVSYQGKHYGAAVQEWEKVLMFNPEQEEVKSYLAKTKVLLIDENKRKQEKEHEENARQLFARGSDAYAAGSWVTCIKTMEQVQSLCKGNPGTWAIELYLKAGECIDKAVKTLSGSINKSSGKRKQTVLPKQNESTIHHDIDEEGSAEKYRAGLVLYAQGKTADAVRWWEIALRMNPANEKAATAIDRAKSG